VVNVRRLRRAAWLSLALLSLFTMAAGVAVAHMLPPRLALWRLPAVAARRIAAAGPVLGPVPDTLISGTAHTGQAMTSSGVTAALAGLLGSPSLGPHVGAVVYDLSSGQVLLSRLGNSAFAPASTAKLAVATAVLDVLGPAARLTTRVVAGSTRSPGAGTGGRPPRSTPLIVLVGGGDPTLAAGRPPASDYPQPASLASLAAQTARALRARGLHAVRLRYDSSLFTGPGMGTGWAPDDVASGNVTAIQSLEVDQGRLTAGGAPQDADVPGNFRPRSTAPAASAARYFASFLAGRGIRVLGTVTQAVAPRGSATIAAVSSPPLAEIIQQMLTESNNVIAENLARQVAIATGHPASFSGAAAAETAVLRRLGISGITLVDGSGLSPMDQITPNTLVHLIRLAAAPGRPAFRPVITGLPVAGFSGTLAPGGSVFTDLGQPALGMVRAKTGNLLTVVSLAGVAYARNGHLLAFAFMADQLPEAGLIAAGDDMTRLATALAACGCR
jgi:D-alanyl-D-alanine carboxypeptidase/D-alanyl-D-alanine-endopeptidase (penicillin-binding protein 4)